MEDLSEYLSPTAAATDPDPLDSLLNERARRLRAEQLQMSPQPEEAARANELSRVFGVTPTQADTHLQTLEQQRRVDQAVSVLERHPAVGAWADANPRAMAAAADDYDNLGLLGEAFSGLKTLGKNVGGALEAGLYQATSGIWGAIGGVADNLAALTPSSERERRAGVRSLPRIVSDFALSRAREGGQMAAGARPDVENWFARNLLQGIESTPTSLAAVGVGILAGPGAGASVAGLTTGGQEYVRARDKGLTTLGSSVYALSQGAIEVATERLPIGHLVGDLAGKSPLLRTFWNQIKSEVPGEQIATILQDLNEWAALNPEKPFSDYLAARPEAAAATLVATLGGLGATSGITLAADRTARAAGKIADRVVQARQAQSDASTLDDLGAAADGSKLRQRDPEAFASMIRELAADAGSDRLYIPSEAVQAYMQSDAYDGSFDRWSDQIEDAAIAGGDFVIPIDTALTELAGKPAWDAVKEDIRLTAGGMSPREAQTFSDAMADVMAELTNSMADADRAARTMGVPRDKLLQSIADKLMNAGFTPSTARQQAELLTQRAVTRASRMGRDLTGDEFAGVEVRQVLPASIAAVQTADQLDMAISVMKRGSDPKVNLGPSLMDFISKGGGIVDTGGDLKAMGADQWHRGKPGKRKLVKDQGELIDEGGLGQNEYGADAWAQRAWEAGYFPEFGDQRPTANDLLDAIGEGVAGRDRHLIAREKGLRDAAQELRALLESRGIDADSASRREIRDAVETYAAEQSDGTAFMQGEDSPRGRIIFPGGQSATAIIELFQSRDQSTFLHETGHLWLEELREDAADPQAPQQVRDDWQLVQDWFAANGHPVKDGSIPVDAHEMWARGVERYLMEGNAPSPGLRRMFQTFKAWLVSLYNSVSRLRTPISDDIRGVMDRLIASDEELADAVATQHLEALFPEKPAFMSADEYAAYQALTANARDAAQDKMLSKAMNAIKRRVSKEYRDREAEVRVEVSERLDTRPEFRALRQLKDTPMDSEWVRDHFGEDATAMLPMQVPPVHRAGGVNPDEVAEIAGYPSGEEMVRALLGMEIRRREMRDAGDKRSVRKAMIDQEVQQIMLDRYGDPLTDGSIAEEALAAVHSDQQGEVLAAELRVLARSTGDRVTPYSVARGWAARQVREGRVVDVASRSAIVRYERAAAKAGKTAMEAVIRGDTAEAFRQKQAQMLNNALVAEARRAADDVDDAVSRLEKWAKRRTVKTVDQDYLERAQLLLEQVEMKERTQRSLNRQESFEAWAAARQAEGYDIVVPPSFAESLGKTHWSRLSVENLLGLDDAVKQIIHLGRLKQTLIDNKEQREFDAVVSEALDGIGGMKQRPPSDLMDPSRWDAVRGKVEAFDAALLKMEQVFDWLDGGNSSGVFNRIVFQPIAEAQAREASMAEDYFARIRAEFGKIDRKQLRRWSDRFTAPELINRETGRPYQMKREQLIAIALNMGNEGNIQRLADGYGWREQSVRDVLNRELTAADWQFVQNIWDILETLWPMTAAMERRVNGVEPDKVEAKALETPHGTLRGGYYPAIYDSAKSYVAEEHAGKGSDLLDTVYTRASTRASATRERSEQVKRPILLQIGVINRHLGEMIHDITHREAVIQADKFLRSDRIMRAVDGTLGPEIRKQFRPWLKYVANSWAIERAGNEGVGAFMQKLRSNTTVVGMGFRFTTMLAQLAGYSNSFEYVGAKWVSAAVAQTAAHPIDSFNFVMEKSSEVRSRMDTLDRDIRQTLQQMQGRKEVITAAKRFAFHGIGYMDRMVVVPTWIGAFNKAQAAGLDQDATIYAADKAVRLSQGAGAAKDLAAIARGTGKWGEALKLMTMFYSYMSAFYQRQRTLGRDIAGLRRVADVPGVLARAWWLIIVPPVLSQILSGRGPEDDEDWGLWAFKQMLFQSLGPIPGVRDLASPVWQALAGERAFDYQFTPMQRAFQSVVDVAEDVRKAVDGKDVKKPVQHALEAAGYWTGLVPGQVATSTQFLVDVANGDQDPETFNEWYQGLTKGKAKSE